MMRSQRVNNPDSLPLAGDGGGSGASRKPAAPAPAPKPSKDERAMAVVADASRLAPYFPRTSLENRPASSSAALVSHLRHNVAMQTSHSQGPTNLGGGIVSPDSPLPLQWWGHGKRSRSRREAPAPEPVLTAADVRRQASLRFRSSKAAKVQARAEMPPPGARGPNLSAAPSSPPRAGTLWLHGYPTINPDSLPIADGGGSSVIRKPVALMPGPTQSKVERAPVVAAGTSCLAPYFAGTSLEHHMTRGRPTSSSAALVTHHLYDVGMHTYQGPNVGGGGGNDIAHTSLEQYKLWGQAPNPPQPTYSPIAPVSHHLLNDPMHTSQGSSVSGGGENGIAGPNAHVPLQWGQRKRSRSRREALAPTAAPKPELTPAEVQAEVVKIMLPSVACDPKLISAPLLPPRAVVLSLPSSSEEPRTAAGEKQPQRQESIKATKEQKGKAPMVEVPRHVEEEEEEEKVAMARPVVPRIVTQLTHEEKEEDWLAMTGAKLPRFPDRGPERVQKQVTNICPGQRLSKVKKIRYRVKGMKSKKGVGGLKGMAMDDEDSDSD